jgi:hypothetical protein
LGLSCIIPERNAVSQSGANNNGFLCSHAAPLLRCLFNIEFALLLLWQYFLFCHLYLEDQGLKAREKGKLNASLIF